MLFRNPSENALERVHGYRKLAEDAQAMAQASELPQVRDAYLRSAARWTTLANLVELGDGLSALAVTRPASWRSAGLA